MQRNSAAGGTAGGAQQPMTEMEKAKLAAVFLVFVLVFGIIIYAGGYAAAGNSQTVSGCEARVFLSSKYSCIASLANSTKNLSMCSILPGQQYSSCIYAVASAQMNVSACDLINTTDQAMYSQCVISLTKYSNNYNYCGTLQGNDAMQCVFGILNATGFSTAIGCYSLTNTTLGAACSSFYYYHEAVSNLDTLPCSYTGSNPDPEVLYLVIYASTLSQGSSQGPGLAQDTEFLGYNESVSDYCYYSVAKLENNPALCRLASQEGAQICTYLVENSSAVTSNST